MTETNLPSPRWSGSTKLVIALAATTVLGLAVWRFQFLVIPLAGSAMIAYLLHPIITFFSDRLKWPRTAVTALLYVLLLVVILALATGAGIYIVSQIISLNVDIQQIIVDLPGRIDDIIHSQYTLFGFTIDLNQFDFSRLYDQIVETMQPVLAEAGARVGEAASGTAEFLGWMLFILLISFYIVNEMPKLPEMIGRFASGPGYESDVRRVLRETQKIWDAFLRGQLILAITVGILNWIGLLILGVRYSFVIGMLSGILIFIPYVGPISITLVGAGVALFQATNRFGIDPVPFAV
ncbi:MAG TPA: AI-2E family transporter, partial [Anaerolineales bacterium]|nr:AI-2E family transporter [Anaerolineales bacterium]